MLVHDSWLAMTNACRRCAGSLLYAFGDGGEQRVDDDERASRPAVGQWDRVVGRTGRDWWQEGSRDSVGQGRKVRCSCAQPGSASAELLQQPKIEVLDGGLAVVQQPPNLQISEPGGWWLQKWCESAGRTAGI